MIRYIKHSQINDAKWNQCISSCSSGFVYAYSWYLNLVCPGWDALVEDDYQAVMPLPIKKKFGLSYLIQPRFVQQLGIFSAYPLSQEKIREFVNAVPVKFLWQDFNLNASNPLLIHGTTQRVNYELDLNRPYTENLKNYCENTRRNIRKATEAGLVICSFNFPHAFVSLYSRNTKMDKTYETLLLLEKLIFKVLQKNNGDMMVAMKNDEVVAGAFFLIDQRKITYLLSFNSPKGKAFSATFLILNHIIEQNSGKAVILDFEGSMIPGVARFFAGFGSGIKNYWRYRNLLARLIRKN